MSANKSDVRSLTVKQFLALCTADEINHVFHDCGTTFHSNDDGITIFVANKEDDVITEVLAYEMPEHLASQVEDKGHPCGGAALSVLVENNAVPDNPLFEKWAAAYVAKVTGFTSLLGSLMDAISAEATVVGVSVEIVNVDDNDEDDDAEEETPAMQRKRKAHLN